MEKPQRVGALVAGIAFGLWALYFYLGLCSTCGSVLSFAVVLPGCVLGFPWGLLWLGVVAALQMVMGESSILVPVLLVGLVLGVSVNGAVIAGLVAGARSK